MDFQLSTPEELTIMLKDELYIKDFWDKIKFEDISKPKAFSEVFRVDYPLSNTHTTRLYRWLRKEKVEKIGKKVNEGLEINLLDHKLSILNRMHKIATDTLEDGKGEKINVPLKLQAETGKAWLDAIKQDKSIKIDMGDNTQINVVQIVQDNLRRITGGATISPAGSIEYKPSQTEAEEYVDAIIEERQQDD